MEIWQNRNKSRSVNFFSVSSSQIVTLDHMLLGFYNDNHQKALLNYFYPHLHLYMVAYAAWWLLISYLMRSKSRLGLVQSNRLNTMNKEFSLYWNTTGKFSFQELGKNGILNAYKYFWLIIYYMFRFDTILSSPRQILCINED